MSAINCNSQKVAPLADCESNELKRFGQLVFFSLLIGWPGQLGNLGHFEADFLFDDLQKGNISGSIVGGSFDQWPAQRARTGIELAYPARNQIYQNVGVANFLQCLSSQFRVQWLSKVLDRAEQTMDCHAESNINFVNWLAVTAGFFYNNACLRPRTVARPK
jgi:hypothetical protein